MEDSACNIREFGNKFQNIWGNNAGVKEGSFSDANEVEYRWERLRRTKHVKFFFKLWVSRQNAYSKQELGIISHSSVQHSACPNSRSEHDL